MKTNFIVKGEHDVKTECAQGNGGGDDSRGGGRLLFTGRIRRRNGGGGDPIRREGEAAGKLQRPYTYL
jgi:hypothetical protein